MQARLILTNISYFHTHRATLKRVGVLLASEWRFPVPPAEERRGRRLDSERNQQSKAKCSSMDASVFHKDMRETVFFLKVDKSDGTVNFTLQLGDTLAATAASLLHTEIHLSMN